VHHMGGNASEIPRMHEESQETALARTKEYHA
jgi:hypothetical protein